MLIWKGFPVLPPGGEFCGTYSVITAQLVDYTVNFRFIFSGGYYKEIFPLFINQLQHSLFPDAFQQIRVIL
jgi:hypothetical protein